MPHTVWKSLNLPGLANSMRQVNPKLFQTSVTFPLPDTKASLHSWMWFESVTGSYRVEPHLCIHTVTSCRLMGCMGILLAGKSHPSNPLSSFLKIWQRQHSLFLTVFVFWGILLFVSQNRCFLSLLCVKFSPNFLLGSEISCLLTEFWFVGQSGWVCGWFAGSGSLAVWHFAQCSVWCSQDPSVWVHQSRLACMADGLTWWLVWNHKVK